jgi:hypothetical protein
MNPMYLSQTELLNYASIHATTPLEKALVQVALDLHNEIESLKEQADDDQE